MTASTLLYSRKKLVESGLLGILFGSAAMALGLSLTGRESFLEMREAALFYVLGPDGPRIFMIFFGTLFVLGGLAMLLRLAGDRTALSIRRDGISFTTNFSSGVIPWRRLDGIHLHATRMRGTTYHAVASRSRRGPGQGRVRYWFTGRFSIPVMQLDADTAQVAAWLDAAEQARARALLLPGNSPLALSVASGRRAA